MALSDCVKEILEAEYREGWNHREIASAHGVSRSYIQGLLSGARPYGGITLDLLETMFPNATLELNASAPAKSLSEISRLASRLALLEKEIAKRKK